MAQTTSNGRFRPRPDPGDRDPVGRHRVLLLAISPVQSLDLFGPLEVFRAANLASRTGPVYDVEVASWRTRAFRTESGLSVTAHRVAPLPVRSVDTFLVAGGDGALAAVDPRLAAWVRRVASAARRTVSICTGSFVLARAGLLEGRAATTHWLHARRFSREFPGVSLEPDRLWVEDGPIFTSAGVSSGMDLALALVARDVGPAVALDAARGLVLFLQRSGGQTQFSAALAAQRAESQPIRELQAWIAEHLDQQHSVETLARRAAMSPRNFTRVFTREVGVSPARFVLRLRVDAARRWLERSRRSVDEIAASTGFTSAALLTRAFRRELRTTPAVYRDAFLHPTAKRRAGRALTRA